MKLALVEVEELLESRLKESGLFQFVHREQSQFLDLEDEVFVELVLTDGSALPEVEKIVRHTAAELKARGIRLESVVRALWEVIDVKYVGPSRTADGSLRSASDYCASLRSGTRECTVIVAVSTAARWLLEKKLGDVVDTRAIERIVSNFLTFALSKGGTSYWDPLLNPRVNLFEAEMSFLLSLGPTFEELRQAIDDALEPPAVSSFLADLSRSGIKIHDFDAVLPNLSKFLGGSGTDFFSKLQYPKQELLKQYFRRKVMELEDRSPEVKEDFPNVFS